MVTAGLTILFREGGVGSLWLISLSSQVQFTAHNNPVDPSVDGISLHYPVRIGVFFISKCPRGPF